MTAIPEHIQIKLKNAEKYLPEIKKLCLKQVNTPRERQRIKIGILLGEMAQSLRACLNYAMWDFSEKNLKPPILSVKEYDKIRWSHDFPIETDKLANSKVALLKYIKKDFDNIYQFLEKAQPYHDKYNLLGHLRTLSNYNSHTIPIEITPVIGNDLTFAGFKPRIFGDKVIIPSYSSIPKKEYLIPCFVEETQAFISKKKKWVIILIGFDSNTRPSLIRFIEMANRKVNELVEEFYTLW